jgi:hypothetical protein
MSYSIPVYTQGMANISSSTVGGCNGSYQTWYLNATPVPSATATNWNWSVSNNAHGNFYIYNRSMPQTYVDVSGGGGLNLTYTDGCGQTSALNGVTIYSSCPGSGTLSYSVFPNPAINTVTVSAPTEIEKPFAEGRPSMEAMELTGNREMNQAMEVIKVGGNISQIILVDAANVTKKWEKYDEPVPSSQLSLTDVAPGLYYLKIYDGHNWTTQKLLVE